MPTITIDNEKFDIPQQVINKLCEYQQAMEHNYQAAHNLELELQDLKFAVKQFKVKSDTAKFHNTKAMRLEAWEAKNNLFKHAGICVSAQQTLF